jgi:hypothetical protein
MQDADRQGDVDAQAGLPSLRAQHGAVASEYPVSSSTIAVAPVIPYEPTHGSRIDGGAPGTRATDVVTVHQRGVGSGTEWGPIPTIYGIKTCEW